MLLKNVLDFKNGKSIPKENKQGDIPIYGSTGIIGYSGDILLEKDSIIIGRVGAKCGTVQYGQSPCWVTDNCIIANCKSGILKYYFYLLNTLSLNNYHIGSAQPLLTSEILKGLDLKVQHSIQEQQHIVDITTKEVA